MILDGLRGAWWTARSLRAARRQLDAGGLDALDLRPPAAANRDVERGVAAVMRLSRHTCLVRCAVQQTWESSTGRRRDLLIGVSGRPADLQAHAWLEGDPHGTDGFAEILRLPAPGG